MKTQDIGKQFIKNEMGKLAGQSEGFKNGVKVALKVGGQKKSQAATYYKECVRRGQDWADGFEYGLLLAVRLLEHIVQAKNAGVK